MDWLLFSYCLNLGYSKDWGVVRIPNTGQDEPTAESEAHDAVWGSYQRSVHGKPVDVKDFPDTEKAVSVTRLDDAEFGKLGVVCINSEYYGA